MKTCPYCNIDYKNLPLHLKLKHPEKNPLVKSEEVMPQSTAAPSSSIQDLKDELEVKRLRKQIELLDEPKTEDFSATAKLLEQQARYEELLRAKDQVITDLKIENADLQRDLEEAEQATGDDDWMKILQSVLQQKQEPPKTVFQVPPPQEKKTMDEKEKLLSQVPPEVIQGIKDGSIKETQLYNMVKMGRRTGQIPKEVMPQLPTKEKFHELFEAVRNSK